MLMGSKLFMLVLASASVTISLAHNTNSVPRLVVGITIDNLRTDYLNAFAHLYGDGGFKKLLLEGKIYYNAQYSSSNIDRASSVATIYTGTVPYNHGIIGVNWMDRYTMRPKFCVDDFKFRGYDTDDCSSPQNLLVSTIGDELKLATDGRSVVYSIAPYREVAVLSAGHSADWALWIDNNTGKWSGSSYYGKSPNWMRNLSSYSISNKLEDIKWEPYNGNVNNFNYYLSKEQKPFKHSFSGENAVKQYKTSALINEEVTHAAKQCILYSTLGNDWTPDLLSLCYYAGTYNGKSFAQCSMELQDTYVRLDNQIEILLQEIDRTVGLQNTLIFITSTGYDNVPNNDDLSKYRIPTGDFEINRCAALLNMYLMAIYGHGQYVESYYGNQLYLNHKLIEQKQVNFIEVLERCQDFLYRVSGVSDVYTSQRLSQGGLSFDVNRVRNSYNPKCSGDIIIQVSPGWNLVNEDLGSVVMSRDSYFYFPLIFYGLNIKGEIIQTPISIERIAPTVSHFMRIRAPNACSAYPLSDIQ